MTSQGEREFLRLLEEHFNAEVDAIRARQADASRLFQLAPLERCYANLSRAAARENAPVAEIFHVVGTNGKGTTAFYLAQALEPIYGAPGLFTSPHLVEIGERFRVGLDFIPYDILCAQYFRLRGLCPPADFRSLTFFDLNFLIAMAAFQEMRVKAIVLEAGLGGRLDSTAVAGGKTVLITAPGRDHVNLLGEKMINRWFEKWAIVRPHNESHTRIYATIFQTRQISLMLKMARKQPNITRLHARFLLLPSNRSSRNTHAAPFADNAVAPVIVAADHRRKLLTQNAIPVNIPADASGGWQYEHISPTAFSNIAKQVSHWRLPPGRLESRYKIDGERRALYIFDGAHNREGVRFLIKFIDNLLKQGTNSGLLWTTITNFLPDSQQNALAPPRKPNTSLSQTNLLNNPERLIIWLAFLPDKDTTEVGKILERFRKSHQQSRKIDIQFRLLADFRAGLGIPTLFNAPKSASPGNGTEWYIVAGSFRLYSAWLDWQNRLGTSALVLGHSD